MRRSLFAVLVALGVLGGPNVSVVRAEVAAVADDLFPLPKDAVAQQSGKQPSKVPESRIVTYDVPRGREAVVAEMRTTLKAKKWQIMKDEPSPSGNAVRLAVKKRDKVWKVSITGDDSNAVIIVTAPAS